MDEYSIPIIDVTPLIHGIKGRQAVAAGIGQACRECGFFYITGHGVDEGLQQRLEDLSRRFFAQDVELKREIQMARGGRAWRGYFPVGDELTSGRPDSKEGMLDRLTGGLYRSTPHRARNLSGRDRLSFPFFFDPNFNAEVQLLPLDHIAIDDRDERWDRTSVHEFRGTYGDYLLGKVSKVFPQLQREVL